MGELFSRAKSHPAAAFQLLLVAVTVNVLGLASSLYVIQVLNRYVSYGVTATLVTLTAGVVLAIAAEYAFRMLRLQLAHAVVGDSDERLGTGLFGLLLTARLAALETRAPGERAELVRAVERAEQVFSPATLAVVSDVPFSVLFLGALALLSPALAGVALAFCLALIGQAWLGHKVVAGPARALAAAAERINGLVTTTIAAADAIRQFGGVDPMIGRWRKVTAEARSLRDGLAWQHQRGAAWSQALQGLMSVAIIGIGAPLVVDGQLDIGALIGANLIAGRALAPLMRLAGMSDALRTAEEGLARVRRFATIAAEPDTGKTLPAWNRRIDVDAVGLLHPGASTPLFSALTLTVKAGEVLVVTGRNGTGKSSFARLLAGLIEPTHGQILIDGIDLRQISLGWWRRQVSYVPQEPVFLDMSLLDNLRAARPDATDDDIRRCLERVGLGEFVNRHPLGLSQRLNDGGRSLAPGVRRRLAMGRALLLDGPLYLLDEPSEGLDREGAEMVYGVLIDLARRGRTIVVVSHDPAILRSAQSLVRFDGGEPKVSRAAELESAS